MNLKNNILHLLTIATMAILLSGCGRSDKCIEADDFGFAKATISSRYDESQIYGSQTSEVTPWVWPGLIIDGKPLYIVVKNFDSSANSNSSGLVSAWCPWYGDKDHAHTLTDFCFRLNPCHITELCPDPLVQDLPITNAPCLMTKGIGLYALITQRGYNPNLSVQTMSSPDPSKAISLHVGNPHSNYDIPMMNNDGTISSAGGVLYNYENVNNPSNYTKGALYFKILDKFYEDNNGQYRVFIKSGVTNGGWDPITWCIHLVQSALFGTSNLGGTDYHSSGTAIIPQIYKLVAANTGFVRAVQLMLTLYVIFSAIGFLMGSLELTQKEIVIRVVKVTIMTALIGPDSWDFFNKYLFIWFYDGASFIINILYQVAASGPGSSNPLDFFFSEEIFLKLFSLLLSTPTGWIFILLYLIMLVYLVKIYFDAAIVYMTAIIMVGVLICTSPIFIALALFQHTRSFFENWVKQIMAYSIQMILVYAGILFMTLILRNQIYNTLGFATCSFQFPNVFGITIWEWPFPKILSWSDNPKLANIPIPKDHFESAEQIRAQDAARSVAQAQEQLKQAQKNLADASHLQTLQNALTQAQSDQNAANQNLTYAEALAQYNLAQTSLSKASAQVKNSQTSLTNAQNDQTFIATIGVNLTNFSTLHPTVTLDQLQTIVVAGIASPDNSDIVSKNLASQIADASALYNSFISKIDADKVALTKAQNAMGTNNDQASRDALAEAQNQLASDEASQANALAQYNALLAQQNAYKALSAQITIDFVDLNNAIASGQNSAATKAKLVADITSQLSYATTIMSSAVSRAQTNLNNDLAIAQNANAAAQTAQVKLASVQGNKAQNDAANQAAQAQANQQVQAAQAALIAAQNQYSSGVQSGAAEMSKAQASVAAAQAALNDAQSRQTAINKTLGEAAANSLGGFNFGSSSRPSATNNTFCFAYECIGQRYPDLPFLDPHDSYESKLINQMRNGQVGDFSSIAVVVICVYLMDHFNKSTVSMARFLSNTSANAGDSSRAAASAASGLRSMAAQPLHYADKKLGISASIKEQRQKINDFFSKAKHKLIDKPWSDHKTAQLRKDAVSGGLKHVRKEAERLSGMSHKEATAFDRNLKNQTYQNNLESLLNNSGAAQNNADASKAASNILSKLNSGRSQDFKDIAAAELFAKDPKYKGADGKIDYSKLSAEDAKKIDKLSSQLRSMLDEKSTQDKFADAYVSAYSKMSDEGVGFLRKRSALARGAYAVGSKTSSVVKAVKGIPSAAEADWDRAAYERGMSIENSKKKLVDGLTPPAFKQTDYKKLYAERKANASKEAIEKKLSSKTSVDRSGPGGQGASHNEPFERQLDNARIHGQKLSAIEKAELIKAMKMAGFTEEQLSNVEIFNISRHSPDDQGSRQFQSFSITLDGLNMSDGTSLTNYQKDQIMEELTQKGFTEMQLGTAEIITTSHEQYSELGIATNINSVSTGGTLLQAEGTLCIQIDMGMDFKGTMSIQVGPGTNIIGGEAPVEEGMAHESTMDNWKNQMKKLIDGNDDTKSQTHSVGGRSGSSEGDNSAAENAGDDTDTESSSRNPNDRKDSGTEKPAAPKR